MQLQVGRIGRAHGIRGEVTVTPFTEDPAARFAVGSELLTDSPTRPTLIVSGARQSGPVQVVGFEGVTDRNAAEMLRGTVLLVEADSLPAPADDDEFYDHQLVGLAVHNPAGELLGEVVDVMHPPAAPVLVVNRPNGTEELVPFVRAIVPEVNVAGRRLTVDPPGWHVRVTAPALQLDIVTIFPEYLAPLRESLLGRAIADELIGLAVHDLRQYAPDRHRTVDDTPYGGGAGMVMKPDVWGRAIAAVAQSDSTLVIPTPAGRPFTQAIAADLAGRTRLIFACGRYEGIDQRVAEYASTTTEVFELSIGDYVLAGGEAAVLVMVEAIARLIPGVLGNPVSAVTDSFGEGSGGLLEYPSYTRPLLYQGLSVPPVLLSGHHGAIERWRRDQSLRRTARRRPDLIAALDVASLDRADLLVLEQEGVRPGEQPTISPGPPDLAD